MSDVIPRAQISRSSGSNTPQSSSSILGFDAERLAPWILGALIVYAAIRNVCEALTRPFWFDELCTWVIVHQQRISGMWAALSRGVDGQPPGYYVIERVATIFGGNELISFRVPSIAGFSCLILCLFVFIRKRSGNLNALLCASIPLFTVLFDPFAVEARPYSLVAACLAIALVCYQHAPAIRWMTLLGLSFALAQAFHYYSIISFVPFVASEAVLLLRMRRIRWPVWLAFSCGLLPLAGFWSLLSQLKAYYGSHFWAVPSLEGAVSSYGWFFNTTTTWGLILAGFTTAAVLGEMFLAGRRASNAEHLAPDLLHEHVLVLGFLMLPFVGLAFSELTHGGMSSRYSLPAILGFPLAASYVLPRIKRRSAAIIATLALLLAFTLQERKFWSSYNGQFVSPADSVQALVTTAGYPDLPVVVSHPHDFFQLAYYASPEWRTRFVSVVDPPEAVVYTGSDSADKELQVLRYYTPLQVYDFDKFAAEHPTFLLYSSNAGLGLDWWVGKLFRSGYKLKLVAMKDYYHRVFLVTKTKATP